MQKLKWSWWLFTCLRTHLRLKGHQNSLVMGAQNLGSLFPVQLFAPRNCLCQINKQFLQQEAEANISVSQQKLLLTSTLSQLFSLTPFLASQISVNLSSWEMTVSLKLQKTEIQESNTPTQKPYPLSYGTRNDHWNHSGQPNRAPGCSTKVCICAP